MHALQKILVDWRRLEVYSWPHILEQIHSNAKQVAVLSSWPLFETTLKLLEDTKLSKETRETSLILMFIEWINHSSLADFNSRLFAGELLAKFIDEKNSYSQFSPIFSKRILSIVQHFSTFSKSINEELEKVKSEVQEKLTDFIGIFKYNDLNIWSVKDSKTKAHSQLFTILKKFKVSFCYIFLISLEEVIVGKKSCRD